MFGRIVVLLSDFGESEYVGAMKGVILSKNRNVMLVDLTHTISPQTIIEGAWVLLQNYKLFPKETVFLCVIDPGVGGRRDAVVVTTEDYFFVGPDNGLLFPAASDDGIKTIQVLDIPPNASSTFHGRDVFAKAVATIVSDGITALPGVQKDALDIPFKFYLKGRMGEIVRIDHFGNIVTNIPHNNAESLLLKTGFFQIPLQYFSNYEDAPERGLFAITGSSSTLEISAKNARAADLLSVEIGDRISLE